MPDDDWVAPGTPAAPEPGATPWPAAPSPATPPPPSGPPPGPPPGPAAGYGPPPGYGQGTPPPPYAAPAGVLGAVHKPGVVPLRPLALGDFYDGAVKVIRNNPKATVGSAVLVSAVAMLLPILVTTLLTFTTGTSVARLESDPSVDTAQVLAVVGSYGALVLGSLLQALGTLLVTGMNAHVTLAAAAGRRLSLGEAWAATHGKRWRLIGLSVLTSLALLVLVALPVLGVFGLYAATDSVPLVVVAALLTALALMCALAFFWIRLAYLSVPALMLEDVGIRGALGRAWRLTAGQFWRTLGIGLLTALIVGIAGNIVSAPFSIVGQVGLVADPGGTGLLVLVVCSALGSVVSAALTGPFTASVTSLQYLDQRIRREAFDIELMRSAGLLPR